MLEATANPPLLHIELAASAATWEEAQANVESANEALAGRTGEEKTRFALKIIPWENVALLFNQIEPVVVAAEPDPVLRAESSAPTLNVLLRRAALGLVLGKHCRTRRARPARLDSSRSPNDEYPSTSS